jgi:hypothetical protein
MDKIEEDALSATSDWKGLNDFNNIEKKLV